MRSVVVVPVASAPLCHVPAGPSACLLLPVPGPADNLLLFACGSTIVVFSFLRPPLAITQTRTLPASLGPILGPGVAIVGSTPQALLATAQGSVCLVDLSTGSLKVVRTLRAPLEPRSFVFDSSHLVLCAENEPPLLVSPTSSSALALPRLPITALCDHCYASDSAVYTFEGELLLDMRDCVASLHALPDHHVVVLTKHCSVALLQNHTVLFHRDNLLERAVAVSAVHLQTQVLIVTGSGHVYLFDPHSTPLLFSRVPFSRRIVSAGLIGPNEIVALADNGVLIRASSAPLCPSPLHHALERLANVQLEDSLLSMRLASAESRIAAAVLALEVKWGRAERAHSFPGLVVNQVDETHGEWSMRPDAFDGSETSPYPSTVTRAVLLPLARGPPGVASESRTRRCLLSGPIAQPVVPGPSLLEARANCAVGLRLGGLRALLARFDVQSAGGLLGKLAKWKVSSANPSRATAVHADSRLLVEFDHLDGLHVTISAPNLVLAALLREAVLVGLRADEQAPAGDAKKARLELHRSVLAAKDRLFAPALEDARAASARLREACELAVGAWRAARGLQSST